MRNQKVMRMMKVRIIALERGASYRCRPCHAIALDGYKVVEAWL